MTLHQYPDLIQGTDEWLDIRRGIVTASTVGQLISTRAPSAITGPCPECGAEPDAPCYSLARRSDPAPIKTLHTTRAAPDDAPLVVEPSTGDTARTLTTLLVAERITGWTDPVYVSDDMMRGTLDEPIARAKYAEHYGVDVTQAGFMIRDDEGWRLGYSPDGLVDDDGLIEIKSRRPKKHLATILADAVPLENLAQIQCGLLVSGREWCDYISYSGGMPMWDERVYPDQRWFDAIVAAVETFEQTAAEMVATYEAAIVGRPTTERIDHFAEIEF